MAALAAGRQPRTLAARALLVLDHLVQVPVRRLGEAHFKCLHLLLREALLLSPGGVLPEVGGDAPGCHGGTTRSGATGSAEEGSGTWGPVVSEGALLRSCAGVAGEEDRAARLRGIEGRHMARMSGTEGEGDG